ncbi:FAD-dependent monooxygenase [Micromonospora zamorensis]|uniref:FAD-dependent monooxygenase n=1 Tax=Micromonospora TaxID=1873 RepID=UPI00081FE126|nr:MULTISPECIES: FAD-dependent monooxygenase [Micromonospora]TQJ20647.1 2-polyprenyl-6-methoxyphenol hydroxylase-like FAD-dependent oxidoreductase [Micromonospora sp. A202]WSK46806.1 FAD-dependent monooxygenase [Micromonospora zamorensis]WTE84528.1 FAD-dependent monooxygenase [Micromonospora zamorensis]SCG36483.1 2-polyprenyl-6-methoxyphenol hydroxylase [Micromonospora zamorensis]
MGGSPLRILVVGAGIAGLAVARALRLAGFRPDVTDRLPPGESTETGLYLPGNAARALHRLDLHDPVRPLGQVIHRQHFFDAAGAKLCDVDLDTLWAGVGECRALPRADLHRVLLSGAGGAVRHGAEVRTLDLLPGAVGVTFTDGTTTEYDLVIGADGPRSSVRALAALGGPPRPVGQVVYRAVLRDGPPVAEWTALLGQRSGFLMVPIGAGRLHLYADEAGTEEPAEPLARLRELFADYRGPVPEVLAALDEVHVGITDEVELGRWYRGRVLLIGDAAHATAPTLSQGAAMALEDAVVLAESLRAAGSVDAALVAYESRRRPRTRWVRDRTRDRNRTRDVPPALRDPLLRGRGGRIFGEHYRLLLGPL